MSGHRNSRLRLELSPSVSFAALIVTLHGAAAASILLVLPDSMGALLAAALLGLGLAAAWSRALLKAARSVRAIELEGATGATLELANGENFPVELSARRYVGRFIVTVRIVRPVRRTILVCRDMLSGDSFRALRIWAVWGKLPAVAGKQLPA